MSEKLQKILANMGMGSRREIEQWIADGRVKVNGQVAKLGDRAEPEQRIFVDGRPVSQKKKPAHRVILYNKPTGQICSRRDPEGRPTIFSKLPKLKHQRWIAIGRLDFNTSGLLLLTTDGELANRLMHPSFQIEREYAVRILGEVTDEKLQAMRDGVLLEDGVARFSDIQKAKAADMDDEHANQWYYVVLMEGRNREVRRLWESQGLTVSRLKRVRFGNLFIPSAVRAGRWTDLEPAQIRDLYKSVGLRRASRERRD
ncbi:MAG: 23S rRNA pseudouridine(2605) synthase RluB [Pseudomonadota bacterium]